MVGLSPEGRDVAACGSRRATTLPYVGSAAACDATRGGWHYDNPAMPTRVILCPASWDFALVQTATATATGGGLHVLFGRESLLI